MTTHRRQREKPERSDRFIIKSSRVGVVEVLQLKKLMSLSLLLRTRRESRYPAPSGQIEEKLLFCMMNCSTRLGDSREEENGILEWISIQRGSLIQGEFKEMTHPRAH